MKISATKDGDSQINKSSSGLFLGIVFVLLLTGILGLSLWVSELSKASNSINSKVESRLLILEEQLQLADSTSTESLSDINSQLQFLDKEIRKLWDLSNKRNKVKIAELNQDIEKQTNALKELAATQTNDQKNINAIQQESKKLSIPDSCRNYSRGPFCKNICWFYCGYCIFVYEIFIFIIKSSSRLNMLIYNSGDVGF